MSRCLDPTSYTDMLEPLKWICGFYLFTFLVKYVLNSHSTQKKKQLVRGKMLITQLQRIPSTKDSLAQGHSITNNHKFKNSGYD